MSTDHSRGQQVHERYHDPENPEALLFTGLMELYRQLAIDLGVCADCLTKLPDPLSPVGVLPPTPGTLDSFMRFRKRAA